MFAHPLSQNMIRYPKTFSAYSMPLFTGRFTVFGIKKVSQKETNPYLRIINIKYNIKIIVMSRMPFY